MDKLNVRVLVSADNLSGDRLTRSLQAINASPYKDRFRVLAGIDFRNVGPGWGAKAVAQLEADVKAGAVGVGEVAKSFGLTIRKPDGSRLKVDDPGARPDLGRVRRGSTSRPSSTPPSRRSSFSRLTCRTNAGSSCRSSPTGETTSRAR